MPGSIDRLRRTDSNPVAALGAQAAGRDRNEKTAAACPARWSSSSEPLLSAVTQAGATQMLKQ